MLLELRVENLLLIERAELRLGPGLNVITGETGAGKTMLAHALDLLLGGRSKAGIVRPGAAEAWVEGVLELTDELRGLLGERLPADAEELVVARRVGADGRTRAYLGGRSATVGDLREAGEALLSFYGQHEHRRLALASAQLELLDAFCGPAAARAPRGRGRRPHTAVRAAQARVEELSELEGARERELDLLAFELAEIEQADPSVRGARRAGRPSASACATSRACAAAALGAAEALTPEAGSGATALLARPAPALDGVAGVDPELDALAERVARAALRGRGPRRRAAPLRGGRRGARRAGSRRSRSASATLARLERKHGGTIAGVLAHAEACRARKAELDGRRGRRARRRRRALAEAAARARARWPASCTPPGPRPRPKLAAGVRERLGELAMEGASFEISLAAREEPNATGGDAVEFLIAPNPGVPAGPLREIASGGETSRVMLALMAVAHGRADDGGDRRLLVFDEVDAGIGGVTARAVGAQLRALAAGRQVLCITHLPQIASLADRHFRIAKDLTADPARHDGRPSSTGDEVVGELVADARRRRRRPAPRASTRAALLQAA